ncbi:peptidase inhibitor family I36 protein [Streptomyces sp. 12297]|uniref:peptidase inhibitor family I36 protein n=1 Tax=Streptomyces sp. NBC_00239 TaxID=2903640 RepID=UPI002E2BC49C|nr:peptidase inhibitor family I36 protein [Streptomyces sp. NBC_00239]
MRKSIAALAVTATVAAVVVGGTSAASADTRVVKDSTVAGLYHLSGENVGALAYDNCLNGQTCFFQYTGGGGILWVVPSCGRNKVPSAFNDKASSAWNKGGGPADLFYNTDYTGFLGTMPWGFRGDLRADHQDRLSSLVVNC